MSHKLLVFLLGLLLVSALGSYIYYRRVVASVPVDAWALVPDDAVFVAATRDHATLVRHLKETQLWDNLTAVRYFQQVEEHVTLVDSLTGTRNAVLRFLGTKKVLTSVHVTGPQAFDVLFQVPIGSVREYRQVRTLVDGLGRDPRYQVLSRDYQGEQLTNVRERATEQGVTFFNYRNRLIMSANADLVEAVVRRLQHPGLPSVAADFQSTDFLQLKDVDATLLINYRRLPQFMSVFFRADSGPDLAAVSSLARNGQFEMKLAGNKVVFNGFANPEPARDALHQRLRQQPAQRLRMADVLSLRSAIVVHLGLGPVQVLRSVRPAAADSLSLRTAPLVDSLAAGLMQEVALCYLATPSARTKPARLALAYCANPARTAVLLGQLRRLSGASPAFERVGPYQLYQTGVPDLPARLLGPMFTGFGPPAVVQVGDYVAFGEDAEALRLWLTDVVAGEVWSRSPTQVAFLQETQPLARMRVLIDTRNSWNVLLRALVEERRAGLLRNETLFKRFPQIALQFVPATNEGEPGAQYFTQLVLRHPAIGPAVAKPQSANGTGGALAFKTPLTSAPTLVPVIGTRVAGVVVQDDQQVLHYVTPDNVVAWSDSLPGPVVGRISRAAGGSGGYLFATPTQIHALDESGREQPNFPLNLPDSVRATSLTVSPGSGRTAARLLVGGGGSNLFLYDTNGRAYPGWQPKQMEFGLAAPPHYLVVGGRDVIVVLLDNGYVYAYDEQGSVYPGFPISMGARLHSGAFVESGPTLRRTRLSVITQHGERVSFNLSGDIVERSRVATWSRNSVFQLIPDQNQRDYVVAREDGGRLSLFGATGRLLLSQRFVTSGPKSVQYLNFGPARRAYVLTEPGPRKAYIYDSQGRLVGGQPFDSSLPTVGLDYDSSTNTYQLYRVIGNELRRTALKMN
ncbi:PQQ-binding-like beta-propeller repeat protein [Hymenobacter elongatus]|uniref:DUF3352 domain-containing protein n=1 Tax=Hymenobacter elongatus TaxID=877208 RepID=A0A4Z0PT05_9BACT|nr:PQQ-binding-like beta-propeller repeat protein [Hymenobacter elongatus]TGE20131.1 hypothetical protein E5J99_00755 [Hymenobacter elongatus]